MAAPIVMSRTSDYDRQPVDYDSIASAYDRRYEENEYAGIERALLRLVGSRRGARVLEVGCGTGHWLELLARHRIWAAGVDASHAMLARAPDHTRVAQSQAEFLPWKDGAFDRIACIHALHHFTDPPAFVREAQRLLRAGGTVMVVGLDPHTGLDRWCIYEYFEGARERDEQRYPASSTIRAWMAAAGFEGCTSTEIQHLDFQLPAREALAQGRLDRAVTSQLSLLSDAEYERGLERIREGIRNAEAQGASLRLNVDLRLYATVGSRR